MNNKIKIWFEKQRKPPYNTNLDRENLRMITIRDLEELEELLEDAFEEGKAYALEEDPCKINGVFDYL